MISPKLSQFALVLAFSAYGSFAYAAAERDSGKDMIINDEFLQEESKNRSNGKLTESESRSVPTADTTTQERSPVFEEERKDASNFGTADSGQVDSSEAHVVHFEFDSSELTDKAKENLQPLVNQLQSGDQSLVVGLAGYTDATGPEEYNKDLAERRAEAVKQHFAEYDVDVKNWDVEAPGEEQPVASNDNVQGRQENRRVEIQVMTNSESLGSR